MQKPEFFTVTEVLRALKIKRTHLYNEMRDGRFPKPNKIGRRSLWLADDVYKWMNGQAGIETAPAEPRSDTIDLRDEIALRVLPALICELGNVDRGGYSTFEVTQWVAEQAYRVADAMLLARTAPRPSGFTVKVVGLGGE